MSGDLFASLEMRPKIENKIYDVGNFKINIKDALSKYRIIIAIIAKDSPSDKLLDLPLFSKLCLVNTITSINKLGYNQVELLHIPDRVNKKV